MKGVLLDQTKRTIDRYHLLDKGDRVVVGVSAGVDSMVLLHLLNAYRQAFNLSLIVAYVNHGLRPIESEKEVELVQKESDRLGLSFEYGKFNVREFQKTGGFSLQDAARKVRFQFLNGLLKKYNANKIALGHNANDQVETVLIRLIRGSGLKGLKGMLPIRDGRVIRPLLEVWREEIEAFAIKNGIPYLIDSSNLNKNYIRNRLRLNLIPLIEREYQPNFKASVIRTLTVLREENDYLERVVEEAYQKMVFKEQDTLSFKFSEYQPLHKAIQWRMIEKILGRIYSVEEILYEGRPLNINLIYKRLCQPSSSFLLELPHGVFIEKQYDMVLLRKGRIKPIPPFEVELIVPGRTFIKEIEKEVVIEETHRDVQFGGFNDDQKTAFFDYQNLQFPLKMRNFRPGDRFQPLGLKGTQKLKEFFIDHKIPKYERPRILLLISGERIAWVVGFRIDERVKVTEKTQRVLKVTVA